MKSILRKSAGLAALGAALCLSTASFAQPSAAAQAAHDQRAERMHEHAEVRARALRDILNVRPDQEDAFQALLATMDWHDGDNGVGMRRDMATPDREHGMEGLTALERMDRMTARMAERQSAFQRRADVVRRFYGVLSPDQRRAFDGLASLMSEGHSGMGRDRMVGHYDNDGDDD